MEEKKEPKGVELITAEYGLTCFKSQPGVLVMSSPRVTGLTEQHTALYLASKSRANLYKEGTQGPLIQHVDFSLSYPTCPGCYFSEIWGFIGMLICLKA